MIHYCAVATAAGNPPTCSLPSLAVHKLRAHGGEAWQHKYANTEHTTVVCNGSREERGEGRPGRCAHTCSHILRLRAFRYCRHSDLARCVPRCVQVPATVGPLIKVRDRKYGRTYIAVYGPAGSQEEEDDELVHHA